MKRIAKTVWALAAGILLSAAAGCGSGEDAASFDRTTIMIEKDGSVSGTEVDVFDAGLYRIDELEKMTAAAVEDYNAAGKGTVELVSVEELDGQGQVRMVMHYDAAATYVEFNTPITRSTVLYYGTVGQARTAGYFADVTLMDVRDGSPVSEETAGGLDEKMVLVTSESVHIRVPEKIAYYSEGVSLADDAKEADLEDSASGLFYVVLK